MEDLLDKYTMREFLEWLEKEPLDEYMIPHIVTNMPDDTTVVNLADVEALKTAFLEKVHRYEIFIRGYRLYIHDNKTCQDIMSWIFTDETRDQYQEIANNVCKNLNNGTLSFTSREKPCW